MTAEEEAGSNGLPELRPEPARTAEEVPDDSRIRLPRGLTKDGLDEYERLRAEHNQIFELSMDRELTRLWLKVKRHGPASFTWDRVQEADAARREAEYQKILGEARPKLRAEFIDQLRDAEERLRRATEEHRTQQAMITALQHTVNELQPAGSEPSGPDRSSVGLRRVLSSALVAGCGTWATLLGSTPGDQILKIILVIGTAVGAAIWPKR